VKISQREARRLRKKAFAYESQERARNNAWAQEWPNGVHIGQLDISQSAKVVGSILTSRKLGHAVVATITNAGTLNFHAVKL
jgi:hypothetical protein